MITRVDNKWVMSWIEPDGIAFRDLNILERIRYYFRIKRHNTLYPNWKETSPYR
jgi:hypothetical protein